MIVVHLRMMAVGSKLISDHHESICLYKLRLKCWSRNSIKNHEKLECITPLNRYCYYYMIANNVKF